MEQVSESARDAGHPLLGAASEAEADRYSGTTVRAGNAVVFLPSGAGSYAQRWAALEAAERSIDLVSFSMMRDGTTRRLCDLLLQKLRQGVRVRIIVDDAVAWSTLVGPWLRELQRAGAGVVRYSPIFRDARVAPADGGLVSTPKRVVLEKVKHRFHEKYTVVDGRLAILGGINWGDKYAYGGIRPKAWRDSDVLLTGPVVADVRRQFEYDWALYSELDAAWKRRDHPDLAAARARAAAAVEALERGEGGRVLPALGPAGPERIRYVPHKPYDEDKLRMTEQVLLLVRQARRSIHWGCHGIRPPRLLAEALAAAVARGVEVRLVTNSRPSSRTLMFFGLLGWMYWESSNHFPWLLEHGVRVFEWQRPGAFHSKNLVIDDVVASVGSYNVASGSCFHHTESNVVVYGGDVPVAVRKQFEADLADCVELSLDTVRTVPPEHQPMRRLLHPRNLLVPRELRSDGINADLDAGRYKRI
ncbi:MAG TPA: phosphatidylserine/phosphatidylglycerophosphate/cardiolipin synthase family protein [Anaeromyxobacter sp.]|nr:phosphatidylserine/phosphatidylglycerophosphate/cardiolipin synthase family protein [Anaeromyxobacter sp.]